MGRRSRVLQYPSQEARERQPSISGDSTERLCATKRGLAYALTPPRLAHAAIVSSGRLHQVARRSPPSPQRWENVRVLRSLRLCEPASRATSSRGVAVHGIEVASSSAVVSTCPFVCLVVIAMLLVRKWLAALAVPKSTTFTFSINAPRLDRSDRKWARCRPPGILKLSTCRCGCVM